MLFDSFLGHAKARPSRVRQGSYALSAGLHGLLVLACVLSWLHQRHIKMGLGEESRSPAVAVSFFGHAGGIGSASGLVAPGLDRPKPAARGQNHPSPRRPTILTRPVLATVEPPKRSAIDGEAEDDSEVEGAHGDQNADSDNDNPQDGTTGAIARTGAGGPGAGGEGQAAAASPRRSLTGAPYVSTEEATYLRTFEDIPGIPDQLKVPNSTYLVALEVCVSQDGHVDEVAVRERAAPALDQLLVMKAMTWRYRPRLIGGIASAFCHTMRLRYETQ